ncbi:hypothetical protein BUY85_00700 [Staphylococcus equorum]|uniref:SAP domain-containing protein n=1 Tax=Staphylococcus equorum TaxID=246432 RepID=UPI000D1CE9D0|nr:SAP domain-containing protein [Staphylococcus equorum]PTE82289.1 hypothetical protein BUY85_00700 [Staphylococcus equorum]
MNLNANDLLMLHFNANRVVGNETINHNYVIENNIDVTATLNKLVNEDALIIENKPETSLPKLTLPKLKDILRNNNLKLSGNKQELINRIIENYNVIDKADLDLPLMYVPTEKGVQIINETQYIFHFHHSFLVSLPRAHKIAVNHINAEDKIETIYMNEIQYEMQINHDRPRLNKLYGSLANYYRKDKQDKERARMFYNLSYYIQIEENLSYITEARYRDIDINDDFVNMYIEPDFEIVRFYEQLIYVDETTDNSLKNLFIKDIANFYDVNEELCTYLIDYLIAKVKQVPEYEETNALRIFNYANNTDEKDSETPIYSKNDSNDEVDTENKKKKTVSPKKEVQAGSSGCLLFLILVGSIASALFI